MPRRDAIRPLGLRRARRLRGGIRRRGGGYPDMGTAPPGTRPGAIEPRYTRRYDELVVEARGPVRGREK